MGSILILQSRNELYVDVIERMSAVIAVNVSILMIIMVYFSMITV